MTPILPPNLIDSHTYPLVTAFQLNGNYSSANIYSRWRIEERFFLYHNLITLPKNRPKRAKIGQVSETQLLIYIVEDENISPANIVIEEVFFLLI